MSFIQALKKKKLSEKLQDYKVKLSLKLKVTRFCLKGRVIGLQERKDYKNLSKGEGESYLLSRV